EERRPRIGYLTGSVGGAQRAELYVQVATGEVDLLIGTHALIQGGVEFTRLGLAIIDEQHRFGVEQRALLRGKGASADMLVMTATPIPRTLALTLHGDLDVSTLDELPPGRQAIETYWVEERRRSDAYRFVRSQVEQGRQAFIVFPLVEESEAVDARAAVVEHERLSGEVFPDLRLGLLHGRMKPAEKDAVMARFRSHDLDILVSTSVIEVGIDIPNATVMMIDGADRFGLSQLHQFRGRVGRGAEKSYCLLVSGDASNDGRARLQAMVDTQDGFRLAQIDLELRGPGDFLGTRQSGLPDLELAAFADVRDLERARAVAERILEEDPTLGSARYALLRARVDAFWARAIVDVS
ncbi:MAG TPA: helicase-related protein, partial [Thermomicrobiales bacterium]|nr:helicase-related protein [Thermomicrobiales bacterium]